MIITLYIFIISGLLLALLLGLKMAGVSGASIPGWPALRTKGDPFFGKRLGAFRNFLTRFHRERMRETSTLVVLKSKDHVTNIKEKAASKIMPFTDYIKGKRAVDPNAKASSFLNDVKKSKDESRASNDRQPLS